MSDSRRPPSPWRRRSRRAALALGGVVALAGGFVGYLHTSAGHEWLRGRVEAKLNERIAGAAKLGALRFSLFSGVTVQQLVLRDRAGAEVVALQQAHVDPALRQLLGGTVGLARVDVTGVRLRLEQFEDGTTSLSRLFPPRPSPEPTASPRPASDIRIGALSVSDVDLELKRLDGVRVSFVGASLAARVDARPSRQDLTAGATARGFALKLRWPDQREVSLAELATGVEARLQGGAGEVKLGALSATLGGVAADGRRFEPSPISLGGLTLQLEKGQVTAALQQLELLALTLGTLDARVGLGAQGPDGTGQGSLGGVRLARDRVNALAGRPVLASDVELTARLDASRDRPGLDLEARTDGGVIKAQARLDGSGAGKPKFTLEVTSAGLQVQRALVLPEGPPIELGALALKVDGDATSRQDVAAAIKLDLGPSTLRGVAVDKVHAEGRYERGTLSFSTLAVDTMGQHLTGRGDYAPATREIEARLEVRGDLDALGPALVAAGRPAPPAALLRGVSLRDGLAIEVKGSLGDTLEVSLPGSVVGLAGGSARLDGRARLHRAPDEGSPLVLEEGGASLQLQGVQLPALLAMVGRPNPGLRGRLDGTVKLGGPRATPSATYDLTAVVDRGATTVRTHARGKVSRDALALDLDAARLVAGQPEPLVQAEIRAPLVFAGRRPRLDPGRPLAVRLELPARPVETLRDLLPPALLAGPLGRSTVGASVVLTGTARAPEAAVKLDASGPLAAGLGGTQRARVALALTPGPDGASQATAQIEAWLREADAPQLTAQVTARLARSPLVERPDNAAWIMDARLAPQPLAALAPARPRRGELGFVLHASGDRADVQGKLEAALRGLGPAGTPPLDADVTVSLAEERTTIGAHLRGQDADLATLEARVGLGGLNLIPRVRERQPPPLDTPFDVVIKVPDRALASLAAWLPALREAPGTLGGKIEAHGPATRPSLAGKLALRGLRAADGSEASAELSVQGSPLQLGARLEALPAQGEGVALDVRVSPLLLLAARGGDSPLPVNVSLSARGAKLDSLLPASPRLGAFTGQLDSDLGARVDLLLTPEGPRPKLLTMQGALALREGSVRLPGSARVVDRVAVRLAGDGGQLKLESLEAHESDREQPDRSLRASGSASFEGVALREATLEAKAARWLVWGGSFGSTDAPRATLDADLSAAIAFRPEGRQVKATVRSLELLAPERFLRAHQPEVVSLGDVVEISRPDEIGRLPLPARREPVATAPLTPPDPDTPTAPAAPAPAAPVAARPTEIEIELPPGTHLKQAPLDVQIGGTVRVMLGDGERQTRGTLAVSGGRLFLGGRWQDIDHGEMRFDEQNPGGYLDLWFRRAPHPATLRDVTTGNEADVRVHLVGPLGKQKPEFNGLGIGSLFDTMALQNAGRTRYLSQPDLPTSETAQLPLYGQLRQITFMAVNLPHLLFLDRISVWADPYDDRQAYGRLLHHEGESYRAGGSTRVRTLTRPPRSPGQSEGEVSFDWLWQNSPRTVSGVGLKAGTRGGGGPGLFWEWSSER